VIVIFNRRIRNRGHEKKSWPIKILGAPRKKIVILLEKSHRNVKTDDKKNWSAMTKIIERERTSWQARLLRHKLELGI
jgi:hypothetical protein